MVTSRQTSVDASIPGCCQRRGTGCWARRRRSWPGLGGAGHRLLRRRAQREDRPRDLADSQAALQSLARLEWLIGDLLDVRRLEEGVFTLALQPLDLVALARETATAAATAAVPVAVEAPDELVLCADPDRLRQALENLLANAVKHSPPGATVTVTVATEARDGPPWTTLTVADRGPGIAPDLLPHLFDRFVTRGGADGLGLGLYLAHGIATAHGGTLDADSTPGAGARFQLVLPVEDLSCQMDATRA